MQTNQSLSPVDKIFSGQSINCPGTSQLFFFLRRRNCVKKNNANVLVTTIIGSLAHSATMALICHRTHLKHAWVCSKVNLYTSCHRIFLTVYTHEVNRGTSKVSTSFLRVISNYFFKQIILTNHWLSHTLINFNTVSTKSDCFIMLDKDSPYTDDHYKEVFLLFHFILGQKRGTAEIRLRNYLIMLLEWCIFQLNNLTLIE